MSGQYDLVIVGGGLGGATLGRSLAQRGARVLPLMAQDPTRDPDTIFSGPDVPLTEAVRRRFFAEG